MAEPVLRRRLAAVIVVNSDKHVLLQYRGPNAPTSAIQWSLPGGGIEPGETAEEAACRELLEETGLHMEAPMELLWHGTLPSVSQPRSYNEWYIFVSDIQAHQEDVIVGEGEAMVFIPLNQMSTLNLAISARYFLFLFASFNVAPT